MKEGSKIILKYSSFIEFLFQSNKTDEIINVLSEEPLLVKTQLYDKNTVLHVSCLNGKTQVLQFAVKQKLSLAVFNKNKQSLWHMASMSKSSACLIFLLEQYMFAKNQDVIKTFLLSDSKNNSLIHYFLLHQQENIELFKAILNISPITFLDALNSEGYAPIHIAKSYNKLKLLELLRNAGANMNLKNKNNLSIFDY